MQTFYNMDIQREGWNNETPSFTPMDTPFSPAYKGADFKKDMQANKSLFDSENSKSIYKGISLINPTDSVANLDFAIQQKKWQALNDSLMKTKTIKDAPKTRLIGAVPMYATTVST